MMAWKAQMEVKVRSRQIEEEINKKYSVALAPLMDKVEEFKDQFRDLDERRFLKENLYQKRSHSAGRASFINLETLDEVDGPQQKSFFDQFDLKKKKQQEEK
jgi:hypothetical protein